MSAITSKIRLPAAFVTGLVMLLCVDSLQAQRQSEPGSELYFISPADGETVAGPVMVRFGLRGMGVSPAGVDKAKTGHHHLLIDVDTLPALDQPIPSDDNHRHFGGGQTEVTLNLEPGVHTLQLLLGDFAHRPHVPAILSSKITITVE